MLMCKVSDLIENKVKCVIVGTHRFIGKVGNLLDGIWPEVKRL